MAASGKSNGHGLQKEVLEEPEMSAHILSQSLHSSGKIQYLQSQIMEQNTGDKFLHMEYSEGGYLVELKNYVLKNVKVDGDCTTLVIAPKPLPGVCQHVSASATDEGQSNLA
jgi:hypothetical protein